MAGGPAPWAAARNLIDFVRQRDVYEPEQDTFSQHDSFTGSDAFSWSLKVNLLSRRLPDTASQRE